MLRQSVKCLVRNAGLGLLSGKEIASATSKCSVKRFSVQTTCLAGDRFYTDKHEWVSLDGQTGTVGISKYAQDALGDVVYAQLPEAGKKLAQHDECGALESVKAASELYSPVTGTVTEKNKEVEESPGLINTSCYDKGWLFKISLTNPEEMKKLMNESQYETFLKTAEDH